MKQFLLRTSVIAVALTMLFGVCGSVTDAQPKTFKYGPSLKDWNKTVDDAVAFLRRTQAEDGSWSKDLSPGITGIVVTGLLKTKRVRVDDPMVKKALTYIKGLVNEKEKHIAGKGDVIFKLKNYVTCVNVMALVEAKQAGDYSKIIGDAVGFLKKLQWDDGENIKESDPRFGGAGYDSRGRPDLSNTQTFLDALRAAGVAKNDAAFQKAENFVSNCQNLKSEHNKQPWAGRLNDGSFIYTAASGGVTKFDANLNGATDQLPGYGSMTYAGIKSLIYCGVGKDDPRIKAGYAWVRKNYTVDGNPGMPPPQAKWGLYYYYHTMAKCLAAMELDIVVDAKNKRHDWRAELAAVLRKQQTTTGLYRGSWQNVQHWMEQDRNLVTGYALMTLSYCRPTN